MGDELAVRLGVASQSCSPFSICIVLPECLTSTNALRVEIVASRCLRRSLVNLKAVLTLEW